MLTIGRFFFNFTLALCLLTQFSCENSVIDHSKVNRLVGLWEDAVNAFNWDDSEYSGHCEGPDNTFWGRWTFGNDGGYYLDFAVGTFSGEVKGYSFGDYSLMNDSILIIHSENEKNLSYAFLKRQDTMGVNITDTTFTSSVTISIGITCRRYWVKMK